MSIEPAGVVNSRAMIKQRPDYSRAAGGAALGARLRRLSERLDRDATRIYAQQGIRFEQRWFGVLNQLVVHGSMSIGRLAQALNITHVSVSQTSRSLAAAGIVSSVTAPADARRRSLRLTAKGAALVARLVPLWSAFDAAAREVNAEAGDVVRMLDRLDDALARKSMFARIAERTGLATGEHEAD
jgi:DNA-binding MarR family transcriptional regulator